MRSAIRYPLNSRNEIILQMLKEYTGGININLNLIRTFNYALNMKRFVYTLFCQFKEYLNV